jgi:hypothetical protein
MKNYRDEKQIKNPMANIILIFDLQMNNKSMNNNYKSERFGMQKSKNDMLGVSAKLEIFT